MLPFKVNKRYWPKTRPGPKPQVEEKKIRRESYETILAGIRKDRNKAKSDFDLKVDRALLKIVMHAMDELNKEEAAEARKQKAEDKKKRAEDRKQKAEERKKKDEDRKQKAADRKRKAEDRRQKAADERRKKAKITEVRKQPPRTAKVQKQLEA